MAARPGFEPGLPDPESGVLPLDDPAIDLIKNYPLKGIPLHRARKFQWVNWGKKLKIDSKFKIQNLKLLFNYLSSKTLQNLI